MATQHTSPKQADDHARTAKRLQSAVQRVRSQAGAGAQRQAALVDALNEQVAHLVQGHLWGAASPPAQEALRLSSGALFAEGAVSNYTDPGAASRCGTALVQLAVVQLGLGLGDAAGATTNSWQGLEAQLREYQIGYRLSPAAAAWAHYCRARTAIGNSDAIAANAATDELRSTLSATTAQAGSGDGFLVLDAHRLCADARWLAGRAQDSLGFLHAAKADYDSRAVGALSEPERHPKTLVERLAEPLFGLYRDYADRLAMTGGTDLALVTRRALAELLRGLTASLPAPSTGQLAATCADLSLDLVRVDRVPEALEAGQEAVRVAAVRGCSPTIRLLAHTTLAEVMLADGRRAEAKAEIERAVEADTAAASEPVRRLAALVLERTGGAGSAVISPELRDLARGTPGLHTEAVTEQPFVDEAGDAGQELAAERERAHELEARRREDAQRDLERRRRELAAAERAAEAAKAAAEREAAERIRIEEQRRSEAAEAERQELKRRRAERLRRHAHEAAARVQSQRAERRAEITELVETAEREGQGEAEVARLRLELADLDQAERDAAAELRDALAAAESLTSIPPPASSEADGQAATPDPVSEPAAADREERAPAPAEPHEPPPEPPAVDPAQVAPEQAEPEQVAPEQAEPAQVAPEQAGAKALTDDLAEAESALAQARGGGNRKATRQACERLVDQLRPRAQADPGSFGPRLRAELEELAGLRLRGGDLFGSRAAMKEARALVAR